MIVSLGEIEATVMKAARGAGLAWGLAEEAGKAARWLAARRLPWGEALVPFLETRATLAAACPIAAGARIADLPEEAPVPGRLDRLAAPLLLVPFLAAAAKRTGRPIMAAWPSVMARVDREGGLGIEGAGAALRAAVADVALAADAGARPARRPALSGGVAIDDALWSRLDALVTLTYVPESEDSRRRGAGRGEFAPEVD